MNYEEVIKLVDTRMADNLLSWCVRHASLDALLSAGEIDLRCREPQTDTPVRVRMKDLTDGHVRLY